jgi:hypothetical protein
MIEGTYYIGDDARGRALADALQRYDRIGICGAPNTGKTKLCESITDRPVVETDKFHRPPLSLSWPELPGAIIAECAPLSRYVVEGIQVARALRGERLPNGEHANGLPLECLIWLVKPMAPQTPRQIATGKGAATVLDGMRLAITIPVLVVP